VKVCPFYYFGLWAMRNLIWCHVVHNNRAFKNSSVPKYFWRVIMNKKYSFESHHNKCIFDYLIFKGLNHFKIWGFSASSKYNIINIQFIHSYNAESEPNIECKKQTKYKRDRSSNSQHFRDIAWTSLARI